MTGRKIAVTGATGFVARHLRRHLSKNGASLVSISRKKFRPLAGEKPILTKDYAESLQEIRGADALIHLAGLGVRTADDTFDAVNRALTERIAGICRQSRVKRIIYLSGLGVSQSSQLEYFASKHKSERVLVQSGLDYTIFRPSYIVGRDDLLTRHLRRQARRGHITIPGSGKFLMQPILIEDAVRTIAESIASPKFSRKIFDLVGPEPLTYAEYARTFARQAGARVKRIPLETAYHDAVRGRGEFDVEGLGLLVGSFTGDHDRLRKASRIRYRKVTGSL